MIPGGPDLHVKQGSSLRLECQLMAAAESPSYVFWYRETRMINYDNEPGVRFEMRRNGSVLIVEKVKLSHGANYTCSPNNARPAHIMIHVIEGKQLLSVDTASILSFRIFKQFHPISWIGSVGLFGIHDSIVMCNAFILLYTHSFYY